MIGATSRENLSLPSSGEAGAASFAAASSAISSFAAPFLPRAFFFVFVFCFCATRMHFPRSRGRRLVVQVRRDRRQSPGRRAEPPATSPSPRRTRAMFRPPSERPFPLHDLHGPIVPAQGTVPGRRKTDGSLRGVRGRNGSTGRRRLRGETWRSADAATDLPGKQVGLG